MMPCDVESNKTKAWKNLDDNEEYVNCCMFNIVFSHYVSQVCTEFIKLVSQMSVSLGIVLSLNMFIRILSI